MMLVTNQSEGVSSSALLPFIIVIQAIAEDFKIDCPLEIVYVDDLALVPQSIKELDR